MQTNSYYKKTEQLIAEHKSLFEYTQDIVREVLEHNHGNQTKTAKQLGISRTTLWRYLKSK
ncbi:helix-turn-helix domain-containing protein [Streptococcus sobrinus]|nr:helix-turn-helix domain-containing protein [Streptococcus sobrinus]